MWKRRWRIWRFKKTDEIETARRRELLKYLGARLKDSTGVIGREVMEPWTLCVLLGLI